MSKKPVALIIMDGFGITDEVKGNAIKSAQTPYLDKYMSECPNTTIGASGMCVGLPDGQMGNSEVGHTNIGAGRIVYQELTRITMAVEQGTIKENEAICSAMNNCLENNSALHLMGLLSSGGVHSHNTHLYGLLQMAKDMGLQNVYVHCFMDGRDVPPSSGKDFVKELCDKMKEIGIGKIATISGRYYAMDRDNNWDRVKKTYDAMVNGLGEYIECPVEAMQKSYDAGVTDEFVIPCICTKDATVKSNDSIIFFNFRPDRAREITRTFVDDKFTGFDRELLGVKFVCFTQYDATMPNVDVAFKPQSLANTFGEYIAENGLTQLRIAETEKYAHVTFFFNGGVEKQYTNEDRILVKSPKEVATYDLKPSMSAYEVATKAVNAMLSGKYDVMILNFANCDMVGHTGIFQAAVDAVEAVDTCVGAVVDTITSLGGVAFITADHGNADKMLEDDGVTPFTAHTTNVVPFIVVGKDCEVREGGVLADIAPTMLKVLGLEQPAEMTGESIII